MTGRELLRKLLVRHGYMRTGHPVLADNAGIPPSSMDIVVMMSLRGCGRFFGSQQSLFLRDPAGLVSEALTHE